MNPAKVLQKEEIAPGIFLMNLETPRVAAKAQAGQFFVLRVDDKGERIPLTIADFNRKEGQIVTVFQVVGRTTAKLADLKVGDELATLVGPLGKPTEISQFGFTVLIGGGVGVAALYPILREFKKAGNFTYTIQGARSKEFLIWEEKLLAYSDKLILTTDDGSKGRKGVVTDPLKEVLEKEKVDLVFAVGPSMMMKFVSEITREYGVKTVVSLNPIMVDATGMCGACRVEVGGKTYFGCVDGPDFDGHQVNWELLLARQRMYCDEEEIARKNNA